MFSDGVQYRPFVVNTLAKRAGVSRDIGILLMRASRGLGEDIHTPIRECTINNVHAHECDSGSSKPDHCNTVPVSISLQPPRVQHQQWVESISHHQLGSVSPTPRYQFLVGNWSSLGRAPLNSIFMFRDSAAGVGLCMLFYVFAAMLLGSDTIG